MPRNEVCSICGNPHENLQKGLNGKKYCPECIEKFNMIRCSSENCGVLMLPEESLVSGQGYLCPEHWNGQYTFCKSCGAIVKKRYAHRAEGNSEFICEHCFGINYFECDDCGLIHENSNMVFLEINGEVRKVCKECLKRNYSRCPICGELKRIDSIQEIRYHTLTGERKKIFGCKRCVKKVCHRCSSCMDWFENTIPMHEENTCDKCYYGGNIIHDYSYKPKVVPKAVSNENKEILFGIENEIELKFDDPNRRDYYDGNGSTFKIKTSTGKTIDVDYRRFIAFYVENSIPGLFYQKSDGSIKFGMEIVSHPATLEFWQSNKDKIEELFSFLRTEGCAGDEADTVGMHIHVSRNGMTRAHQNSFAAFVYSHREKIESLAGRASNGYTKMISLPNFAENSEQTKRFEDRIINNDDRYCAVNWKNTNTVELRMFQSTLNTSHFIANIEFSHALYHFSRTRTVLECVNSGSWKNFADFISENGYQNLAVMMNEKNLITM